MTYTKYEVVDVTRLGGEYDVVRIGTDSSGRPIFMSHRMWGAWLSTMDEVGDNLANKIDITQGAFMKFAGGGAADSAGYHDYSSCIDTRVWDLTEDEQSRVIRCARKVGWAAWLRNLQHGGFSDPHTHWALLDEERGVDGGGGEPSSLGARAQWVSYRAGRDGLSSNGPDYHWRPARPLPVFNLRNWKENDLPTLGEIADAVWAEKIGGTEDIDAAREKLREAANQAAMASDKSTKNAAAISQLAKDFETFRKNELARDKATQERDEALQLQLATIANSIGQKLQDIDEQVD